MVLELVIPVKLHCMNFCQNVLQTLIKKLLFIDFKKAFDFVNPDLLLLKLFYYGFSNNALELIKNYFFNRLK